MRVGLVFEAWIRDVVYISAAAASFDCPRQIAQSSAQAFFCIRWPLVDKISFLDGLEGRH
jgi:hypothetical protein